MVEKMNAGDRAERVRVLGIKPSRDYDAIHDVEFPGWGNQTTVIAANEHELRAWAAQLVEYANGLAEQG